MKVRALLLGYFFDQNPFYVYHIEGSDILLFKLADISLLFNVPHLPRHSLLATDVLSNSPDCYRDAKDLYLSTKLLGETAVSLNKYLLAEFCKLKPNDYGAGLADSILNAVSRFERVTVGEWVLLDLPIASSADGVASSSQATASGTSITLPLTTNGTSNSTAAANREDLLAPAPAAIAAATPHPQRSNTADNTPQQHHPKSPQIHQIKTEPLSPSFIPASPGASHGNQDQPQQEEQNNNPMALDKVLSNMNGSRRRSGSASDPCSSKKQRIDEGTRKDNNTTTIPSTTTPTSSTFNRARMRNVLPKPVHTVSSQTQQVPATSSTPSSGVPTTLLSKRLLSKQGKNARNLTIFAPSYNGQLGIRSAPLNSNFFQQQAPPSTSHPHHNQQQGSNGTNGPRTHHHHQHHQLRQKTNQNYYYQTPSTASQTAPRTSGLLHPGQSLAPLLSPLTAGRERSPHKQEFAIPPIVPSQQQPPLTAHPSSYHPYAASPMFGSQQQQQQQQSQPQQQRGGGGGSGFHHGFANGTSSRGDPPPLPPPTPTTSGGGGGGGSSLQRQQFLQPFEQLFESIETTRALKSTLDEQIRRSSTLMQTLQASSTTIEGLVRNQIKEAQKELMVELDGALESILGRIEKLEGAVGHEYDRDEVPANIAAAATDPLVVEVTSNSNKSIPNTATTNGSSSSSGTAGGGSNGSMLRSPPTIVRSQNDIGPHEYHEVLNALRERLDRLERQFDH